MDGNFKGFKGPSLSEPFRESINHSVWSVTSCCEFLDPKTEPDVLRIIQREIIEISVEVSVGNARPSKVTRVAAVQILSAPIEPTSFVAEAPKGNYGDFFQ